MRKITFGGANSLDNYIARKDDALDWLMWTDEVAEIMAKFWKTIDTVLMGRKTFELARRQSKGGDNPYPDVKSYIFSRTLPKGSYDGVEIISEDAMAFVRKLKSQEGKDICVMGGGDFAKSLFEAKLIDEVGFNVQPSNGCLALHTCILTKGFSWRYARGKSNRLPMASGFSQMRNTYRACARNSPSCRDNTSGSLAGTRG